MGYVSFREGSHKLLKESKTENLPAIEGLIGQPSSFFLLFFFVISKKHLGVNPKIGVGLPPKSSIKK